MSDMASEENRTIYTIGHSTHPLNEFVGMLQASHIEQVVDVRSLPGSRKFPQFNKEALEKSLSENGIGYIHLKNLGGRRKAKKDSKNTTWRNASFMGYADYMETPEFKEGLDALKGLAVKKPTAYMCSEAVWWRCHRSMISDILKAQGWKVMHIMGLHQVKEHPYTQPAQIVNGELSYEEK